MTLDRLASLGAAAARVVAGAVMPSLCFLAGRHTFGLAGAVGLSVLWAVAYQLALHRMGRRWSVLVTMNLTELLVRSIVALWLGSTTVFFVMPSVVTACFGATYLVSYAAGRPLLAVIADEVLPTHLGAPGSARAALALRWASIAYGLEQITVAGLSILLALRLSPSTYVEVHPPVSWSVFGLSAAGFALFCRRRLPRRSAVADGVEPVAIPV